MKSDVSGHLAVATLAMLAATLLGGAYAIPAAPASANPRTAHWLETVPRDLNAAIVQHGAALHNAAITLTVSADAARRD